MRALLALEYHLVTRFCGAACPQALPRSQMCRGVDLNSDAPASSVLARSIEMNRPRPASLMLRESPDFALGTVVGHARHGWLIHLFG
jgi:hypothetical protein